MKELILLFVLIIAVVVLLRGGAAMPVLVASIPIIADAKNNRGRAGDDYADRDNRVDNRVRFSDERHERVFDESSYFDQTGRT